MRTAFNRGAYHYAAGELVEAIAEYEAGVAVDPADWRARFNLAVALEARADAVQDADPAAAERLRQRATAAYQAVLAERPDDLRATVNLVAMQARDGEPAAAAAQLVALADAHPAAALPRAALAAHLLRAGRAAEALPWLEAAAAQAPGSAQVHLLLGDARAQLGDAVGARNAYTAALRRGEGRHAALLALAHLDMDAGELDEARAHAEQLLLVDPDHAAAHAVLADVLEAQGELEGAVYHLWRVRDAADGPAAEVVDRLRRLYRRLLDEPDPR